MFLPLSNHTIFVAQEIATVRREDALNWEKLLDSARQGKYVQVARALGIFNIPGDNEVSEAHPAFRARAEGVCSQLTLRAKCTMRQFISRQSKYLVSQIL